MNRECTDEVSRGVKMQRWSSFTFWRWTSLFLVSYAAGHAILVVIAGQALRLQTRSLLIPYLLLLCCGFVGASLIYWARQSYERPRSGAIRFALAIFLFMNLYMGLLLVSAAKLDILSSSNALNGYAPYILPTSTLASLVVYVTARRRLEAINQSTTVSARADDGRPGR
jgi:glucan phosphoethanolaminetransferase (alkaline phosphatase superfamily)